MNWAYSFEHDHGLAQPELAALVGGKGANLAIMTTERIRHMPVMENDDLKGIVSIGDVVKARLGQLEHENDQLYGYIQGR